jgi:hypothetical protein
MRLLTATLLFMAVPTAGFAWGRDGHEIVSTIAETRLTSKTLQVTREILGGASLAQVSTWSDQVRPDRPETAPWHYVNIHIADGSFDSQKCPEGDCVTGIIPRLAEQLRSWETMEPLQRKEALKHLIHFVGDQAQPLHNANEDDLGGNTKTIRWFGREMNLHSLWDSGFLDFELRTRGISAADLADELNREIRAEQIRHWTSGNAVDWTNDSHLAAVEFAYPGWSEDLGTAYFRKNIGPVRLQLQKGGVRLAYMLNDVFDPNGDQ